MHTIVRDARDLHAATDIYFLPAVQHGNALRGRCLAIRGSDGTKTGRRFALMFYDKWVVFASAVQMSIAITEPDIISRLDETTAFLNATVAGGVDSMTEKEHSTTYMHAKVTLYGYFQTTFWAPNQSRIPVDVACQWRNGCQALVVIVELHSILCCGMRNTVHIRVLEAILVPPYASPCTLLPKETSPVMPAYNTDVSMHPALFMLFLSFAISVLVASILYQLH